MRLSQEQRYSLLSSARKAFGEDARVWLFGSRADPTKRGGDVDVYIECDRCDELIEAKLRMRELIWSAFGEQKVDILVRSRAMKPSAIHSIAREHGVEICD